MSPVWYTFAQCKLSTEKCITTNEMYTPLGLKSLKYVLKILQETNK